MNSGSYPPDRRNQFGSPSRCEVRILYERNKERWLDITARSLILDGSGAGYFSLDLTERKRAESQARSWLLTDPLLAWALPSASRRTPCRRSNDNGATDDRFAVLLLDLDGLKKINRLLRPLGRQPGAMPRRRVLRLFVGLSIHPRYGGRRVCRLPARDRRRNRQGLSRLAFAIGLQRIVSSRHFPQSIGVAAYPQDGETIASSKQQTASLYGMKSHVGKNLLCPQPYDFKPGGQLLVPVAASNACSARSVRSECVFRVGD